MHRQALATARSETLALEAELLACLRPFLTRHNLAATMVQSPGQSEELRWVMPLPAEAGSPRRELVVETCSPNDLCVWARAWGRWDGCPTEAAMLVHLVTLPAGMGQVGACLETARHLVLRWDQPWLYRHGRVTRRSIPMARSHPRCPFQAGDRVIYSPPGDGTVFPQGYAGYITQVRSSHDLLVVDDLPFATAPDLFSPIQ